MFVFQKVTEEEDQKADEYTEISDEDSEVYDQIIEAEDEIDVDAGGRILGNFFILIMQNALKIEILFVNKSIKKQWHRKTQFTKKN